MAEGIFHIIVDFFAGKMIFPIEKMKNPLGKMIFSIEKMKNPLGKMIFSIEKMKNPLGKMVFSIEKMKNPLGKMIFSIEKMKIPLEKVTISIGKRVMPTGNRENFYRVDPDPVKGLKRSLQASFYYTVSRPDQTFSKRITAQP